jgi:hypothetical protein
MNEHKDIATSFKYVVDMETERNTRTKQYQALLNIKSPRVNAKLTGNPTVAVSDTMEHPGPVPSPSTSHNRAPPQESLSPSGSKGKRKVTFDIKSLSNKAKVNLKHSLAPGATGLTPLCSFDL